MDPVHVHAHLHRQFGYGSSSDQLLPRSVYALKGARARSASACWSHSLVVIEEGIMYSLGYGADGQIGHGSGYDLRSTKMVDVLLNVRIAAAAGGNYHLLALAADGAVFSWGSNFAGKFGLEHRGENENLLKRVEALSGFNALLCGNWGSRRQRRGSSKRALHVGPRSGWEARAWRHRGLAGATASGGPPRGVGGCGFGRL